MDVKSVLITGADTAMKRALESAFAEAGCAVSCAGCPPDMFIYVIGQGAACGTGPLAGDMDLDALLREYEACALNLLREVHAALPLHEMGRGRRLCFVTSVASSVNLADEIDGGCGRMVSAACNMAVKILFNRLRSEGYTFRVYAAREEDEKEAAYAAAYFTRDRSNEPESPAHSDENRLVMRDRLEHEIPW